MDCFSNIPLFEIRTSLFFIIRVFFAVCYVHLKIACGKKVFSCHFCHHKFWIGFFRDLHQFYPLIRCIQILCGFTSTFNCWEWSVAAVVAMADHEKFVMDHFQCWMDVVLLAELHHVLVLLVQFYNIQPVAQIPFLTVCSTIMRFIGW